MTRTPLSRSKGQGHQAALLTAALTRQVSCSGERGNILSVGTYCYVAVCRRGWLGSARRFGAHRGRRVARAYCGGRPPTACLYLLLTSLFGYVERLDPGIPAYDAVMMDTYEGGKPIASWRRPSGRPCSVWLNIVQEDANALLLSTLWRSEITRGHAAARRSTWTTQR